MRKARSRSLSSLLVLSSSTEETLLHVRSQRGLLTKVLMRVGGGGTGRARCQFLIVRLVDAGVTIRFLSSLALKRRSSESLARVNRSFINYFLEFPLSASGSLKLYL